MPRYVALLRGVSPMNLKMPALKLCLEDAGFTNVRTLLSSGNVAFDASRQSERTLARRLEAAMAASLGRTFWTTVRSSRDLQTLVASDPFADCGIPTEMKRVVTFLREPLDVPLRLPLEKDGAHILTMRGLEIFTAYTPRPGNPAFMALLEKTFGDRITTRTWDTVRKCAAA
jgi:uncharacterized protein (DUF1697 family)